jgi:hypothetical protein
MTYRRSWDDETDACVKRVFELRAARAAHLKSWPSQRQLSDNPCDVINWCVDAAMKELGDNANLDMVASAVARIVCGANGELTDG